MFLNSASWPGLDAMWRALPESTAREETETKEGLRDKKKSLITIAKGTGPVQWPISHEGSSRTGANHLG